MGGEKSPSSLVLGESRMFFNKMIHLQLTLFLLILIGVFLKRKKFISEEGQKLMSDLTVNLILPCNIIVSFGGEIEITKEFAKNCGRIFLISAVIHIVSVYVGKYLFRKYDTEKKKIFSYGIIVSNSSFIGIPIIDALYGEIGVLYTSLFQIPARIMMWTSGLALFTEVDNKTAIGKVIKHPCIVSIGIGIILRISNIQLPEFINNALTCISNCTIPISTLAIGAMFSKCKIAQLFDKSVLYYSVIRLAGCPVVVMMVLKILNMDETLMGVVVLLTGMPMAGTTAILAEKYHGNSQLAAQTIFVSTMLSIVTLPINYYLLTISILP